MTERFSEIALLEACAKHEPMRVSVLRSASLTEDMRALEVMEASGIVTISESSLRKGNFCGVCDRNLVHDRRMVEDVTSIAQDLSSQQSAADYFDLLEMLKFADRSAWL